MKNYLKIFLTTCILCVIGCANDSTDDLTEPIAEGPVTYLDDIQSIFSSNCVSCHGEVAPQAGLSLHTYATVRAGVEGGNVLARMTNAAAPMPPSGLLPGATIEIIQQWVADGYPEEE